MSTLTHNENKPTARKLRLAAARQVLDEIGVGAGQQAVQHLDHGHGAAERRVHLAQLEPEAAAAQTVARGA